MYPLSAVIVAFVAGAAICGAVVWLVMVIGRQAERIAELERLQRNGPAWADEMKLNHRQQLVSIAALNQLAAREVLDALMRISPEMVHEVIKEIAPHLYQKGDIK